MSHLEPENANRTFSIVAEGDDPFNVLGRYWAGTIDPSGKATFTESVAAIADDLGIQATEVTRLARTAGSARRPDWTCPSCGDPWVLRTRSESKPSGQRSRCESCNERDATAAQAQREADENREARRQNLVSATYTRGDIDGPAHADLPDLAAVAFDDLVSFYTWLLHTGPDGILVPGADHDIVVFAGSDTEGRLHRAGLVRIDPSTSVSSFIWDDEIDDPRELPQRYWPSRARFHLPGVGPLRERVQHATTQVEAALGDGWPAAWVDEAVTAVRSVLATEAVRYLTHHIERHHLPAPDRDQSEKLVALTEDALETYSLGQCYTLIWRSAKDGAAATKRYPMSLADGTSHAVNQFGTNVNRSRDKHHELHEYQQPGDLPFAAETYVLVTKIFALDPMTVLVSDVEQAARDRLSDDDTLGRFIAEGLPPARARAAIQRLADLPAFGDQVDPLILGISATVTRVLEHGGTESDAVRTAYFSLDLLRTVGAAGEYEIDEAQITIRDAIAGSSDH